MLWWPSRHLQLGLCRNTWQSQRHWLTKSKLWRSIVIFERMLQSQISWGISEPPPPLIDSFLVFFVLFVSVSKNTQVLISPTVISTHVISSLNQCYFSLSLSLSISLSLLLALFSVWFTCLKFHINTRQIWCLIIIHHNKLTELTALFHLGDRTQ